MALIDTNEIAQQVAEILRPEFQRLETLIANQGKEDKFITIEEAMNILCFKTKKAILSRIESGQLTKYKNGHRVTLSHNEVRSLMKPIN